jgi:uracil-DNA glycosylase
MTAQSRALARLVDAFDAEVLINLGTIPTFTPRMRARHRMTADEQVADCTGCSLHSTCRRKDGKGSTWPNYTTVPNLIVLTAHPTPDEDRYGRLIKAAIAGNEMVEHVAYIPVVSCVPRTAEGTLRHATNDERKACEANLWLQIKAAQCPNILIIGEQAMKAWRSDLTINQVDGVVGTWMNQWMVTVVPHPSTAKHKQEQLEWVRSTKKAIDRLMSSTVGGIGHRCTHTKCNEPVGVYDSNALPWCLNHIEIKTTKRPRDFVDVSMFQEETA